MRIFFGLIGLMLAAPIHSATIATELCESYEIGFPSLPSVQHRIARAGDPRFSLDPDRPVPRTPDTQRSIETFDSWIAAYMRVVEAYLLGNQEDFELGLTILESSFRGQSANDSHMQSMALFLIKIYSEAQPPVMDRERLATFETALQLAQAASSTDLNPSENLAVSRAQAWLGFLTGDIGMVKSAGDSSSKILHSMDVSSVADAGPDAPDYSKALKAKATSQAAYANTLLGEMTGEASYFEDAIAVLQNEKSSAGAECTSELAGETSYRLAYAYLRLAQHIDDPQKSKEQLAQALRFANAARRALELLYYPAGWRRAHMLSADIYQEFENRADSETERQDFRRLKERAFFLSKTG